jgi:hypothetical protein
MINPNNLTSLSNNLDDVLGREVPINELAKLTNKQRATIAHLIYAWSRGDSTAQARINQILV